MVSTNGIIIFGLHKFINWRNSGYLTTLNDWLSMAIYMPSFSLKISLENTTCKKNKNKFFIKNKLILS